jgi:putative oxidoreductase
MPNLTAWAPRVLSILRIVTALLYMQHGLMKLFHFPAPQPGVTDPLPPLLLAAAVIEVVGGTLLTLGLFTRLAAFICSGQMAFAYFMVHAPNGFYPALNMGEAAVMYCFAFLYLVFAGPGPWSLDAVVRKRA